jgi:hypothetical protein
MAPDAAAAPGTLVLCDACDQFFYENEPQCPHCHSATTDAPLEADDSVRVVRQMIRHRSEIDRILQRIAQFAPARACAARRRGFNGAAPKTSS